MSEVVAKWFCLRKIDCTEGNKFLISKLSRSRCQSAWLGGLLSISLRRRFKTRIAAELQLFWIGVRLLLKYREQQGPQNITVQFKCSFKYWVAINVPQSRSSSSTGIEKSNCCEGRTLQVSRTMWRREIIPVVDRSYRSMLSMFVPEHFVTNMRTRNRLLLIVVYGVEGSAFRVARGQILFRLNNETDSYEIGCSFPV